MANTDFSGVNASLKGDPQYQAALDGRVNFGGFPTGPDGLVLPGFRQQNARAYAEQKLGRGNVPSGGIRDTGEFYDPNADHWYSDPRVLGPIVVGAAGGLGAALGGPPSMVGTVVGESNMVGGMSAPAAALPATFGTPSQIAGISVPTATQGGVGLGGVTAAGAGAGAAGAGAKFKDFFTNPKNIAGLAATGVAMGGAAGGGGAKSPMDDATVQQLMQMALKRQQRTDPLHDSVTQLAMAMMPTGYQR